MSKTITVAPLPESTIRDHTRRLIRIRGPRRTAKMFGQPVGQILALAAEAPVPPTVLAAVREQMARSLPQRAEGDSNDADDKPSDPLLEIASALNRIAAALERLSEKAP